MKYKIGIIGCGNMATAIAKGIINSKLFTNTQIIMSDINENQRTNIQKTLFLSTTKDNNEVAKQSDIILFAVKPQYFEDSVKSIDKKNFKNKVIVSIMAGVSIKKLKSSLEEKCQILRVMPNTPAFVNEAMSVICPDENVSEDIKTKVFKIFESIGKAEILPEKLIDAVTAISGSAPAYMFIMIEAMADAGVSMGLSRNDAYTFAAQTMLGSAKMYLESNTHPAALKDMVCSPAGTTIEAVKTLEKKGFRSAIIEAMSACYMRSKNMQ